MPRDKYREMLQKERKRYLHIVLILTFIGSGMSLLSNLMMGLMLPSLNTLNDAGGFQQWPEIYTEALEMSLARPQAYYLVGAVLYALSLAGAIMMWQLRKNGFHFYVMAQLLLMAVNIIFLGREGINLGDVMLTVLFIAYYYLLLRGLGLFGNKAVDDTAQDAKDDEEDDQNDDTDDGEEENKDL